MKPDGVAIVEVEVVVTVVDGVTVEVDVDVIVVETVSVVVLVAVRMIEGLRVTVSTRDAHLQSVKYLTQ